MKKSLLLLTAFLTFAFASAQVAGDTFVDGDYTFRVQTDGVFEVYISGSTATGDVTFPTSALSPQFAPYDVVGVHGTYNGGAGAGITALTIPAEIKTFDPSCFRGLGDVVTVTFVGGEVFGNKLFRNNASLDTVVLPNTITSWDVEIFSQSSLSNITLGNCPEINNRMFRDCPITKLTCPATLTSIGVSGWNNSNIVTLIMEGSTPPVIDAGWEGTAANITAYVNAGDIATYQAAPIWADMTIIDVALLSVQSIEALNVSVYPNPTRGDVFVQTKQKNAIDLTVFDLNGRSLLSVRGNKVDMSTLSQGIYILKGKTEDGEFAQRIVKQ